MTLKKSLLIILPLFVICGCASNRVPNQNAKGCSVIEVKRPAIYFGAIESWIEIVANCDAGMRKMYLTNLSPEQDIPMVGQVCNFRLKDGSLMDAVGDRLISDPMAAKIIDSFQCRKTPGHPQVSDEHRDAH